MYSDKTGKKNLVLWICIAAILIFLALFIIVEDPGRDISEESAFAIKQAVEKSALQCYVVEGVYPPNLKYLEDNYGLHVNKDDFYITYNAFASNLPPTVVVSWKNK